ncbi:MAG: hypothetical protein V3W09_03790 [Nitrososphaerales archaeon]
MRPELRGNQTALRMLQSALLILALSAGASLGFGADDLNLSEITPQPQDKTVQMNLDDYQGILNSFGGDVDDPELKRLLDQLDAQLENGDAEGARRTNAEIQRYIEKNPEAAPYGLNELLMNSLMENIEDNGKVDVDLQSLSESIQLGEDWGEDSPERAAKLQELANLLSETNPGLANMLMDMANLINLGRDEDARTLYQEVNKDLFNALLQMDPELVSKAFEYLGEGIGETGSISAPEEAQTPLTPSDILPSIDNLGAPIAGAPVPFAMMPDVNLTSPDILLYAIIIPLLLLPLFAFQKRLQVYIPKAASSVVRMVRPVEVGDEPSDPRERIFYHFRRLVRVMNARDVGKQDYETHREFADKFAGRVEETPVKKVSEIYEVAKFTDTKVMNEKADLCAKFVDSVEKQGDEVSKVL